MYCLNQIPEFFCVKFSITYVGVFGWCEINGVLLPTILRQGDKTFLSVRMVELKLMGHVRAEIAKLRVEVSFTSHSIFLSRVFCRGIHSRTTFDYPWSFNFPLSFDFIPSGVELHLIFYPIYRNKLV